MLRRVPTEPAFVFGAVAIDRLAAEVIGEGRAAVTRVGTHGPVALAEQQMESRPVRIH